MKRPALLLLAGAVILVLTGLLLNGLQPKTARLDAMDRSLDAFENAQHVLRRDVISVRAGLLQSFDPLVSDVAALDLALQPMQGLALSPSNAALVKRLRASARRQEALTERLKSDSALLQNSLAYFSTLSTVAERRDRASLEEARLSGAMLRLTLNTSVDAQAAVDRGIRDLAAQPVFDEQDREARAVVLNHARLLRRLLPLTDQGLATLLAEDDADARSQLRAWIAQERGCAETIAQRYRYALYVTAIILTLVIADLAFKLATHVAALKRRSAFEHELSQISAEIIQARPHEAKARIDRGLSRLAAHVQGDAAFLFGEGLYGGARISPMIARSQTGEWSAPARALADAAQANADGLFVGYADWPWRDEGAAEPRRAHVLAVVIVNEHGERCVLGFARFDGEIVVDPAEMGVIRLALDVLAGAVRRARMERQRAALEARLEQASQMQAIGAFASGIAHNFNNILSAIGGYVEMAAAPRQPQAATARHLREIGVAVGRARRLVEQILAYGGRSQRPLLRIDLAALLAESVGLLSAAHGAGARFETSAAGEDFTVMGDAESLQQIIMNLASNALQAMGGAGTVKLGLERRANDSPVELASGVLLAGDYVVLSVEDQGVGISRSALSRIFEPFFTTRAEGNGLGLATTAETARALGGAVNVRSAPGQGARFEVWLPVGEGALDHQPVVGGQGEAILLVGPRIEILMQDEERLAALGYEPIGFLDADRALAAVRDWPERFDAMAVRSDDPTFITALRRAQPDLGLVIITEAGHRSAGALRALAASLGNCRLAPCPVTSVELARLMADAINRASTCAHPERRPA